MCVLCSDQQICKARECISLFAVSCIWNKVERQKKQMLIQYQCLACLVMSSFLFFSSFSLSVEIILLFIITICMLANRKKKVNKRNVIVLMNVVAISSSTRCFVHVFFKRKIYTKKKKYKTNKITNKVEA